MDNDGIREMKRGERRAQAKRVKARVLKILRGWAGRDRLATDARWVGVCVSTHCRPCDCYACTDRSGEIPRPRERAFYDPETP